MKRKPVIAIDVDLTLVRSDLAWKDWLYNLCIERDDKVVTDIIKDYNLGKYYKFSQEVNAFDFWKKADLYDNLHCLPMAIDTIRGLYQYGCEICFVSYCFDLGQHTQSKANMLRRDFSFINKEDFHFVATKSKYLINADYIIDDRINFINQFDSNVKAIYLERNYTQDEEFNRNVYIVECWQDIEEYFIKERLIDK